MAPQEEKGENSQCKSEFSDKDSIILDFKIKEYNNFYKLINPFAEDGTPLPNIIKDLVAYDKAIIAKMQFNFDEMRFNPGHYIHYCITDKIDKKDYHLIKRCIKYLFNGINEEYPRIIDCINNINDQYRVIVKKDRNDKIELRLLWKNDITFAIESKDQSQKKIKFIEKSQYNCGSIFDLFLHFNFKKYKTCTFVLY